MGSYNDDIWIDAHDGKKEGVWRSSNGIIIKTVYWAPGEPNDAGSGEDCVEANWRKKGQWNDVPCHLKRYGLCKIQDNAPLKKGKDEETASLSDAEGNAEENVQKDPFLHALFNHAHRRLNGNGHHIHGYYGGKKDVETEDDPLPDADVEESTQA